MSPWGPGSAVSAQGGEHSEDEDAAPPLAGVPASSAGPQEGPGPGGDPSREAAGGRPRTRQAAGAVGSSHSQERLHPAACPALQKGNINIIIIILCIQLSY